MQNDLTDANLKIDSLTLLLSDAGRLSLQHVMYDSLCSHYLSADVALILPPGVAPFLGVVVGCQIHKRDVMLEEAVSDGGVCCHSLGGLHPRVNPCLPPQLYACAHH